MKRQCTDGLIHHSKALALSEDCRRPQRGSEESGSHMFGSVFWKGNFRGFEEN